ncbi:hypothetical protein PG984_015653 [Apiospora sp. TS-2023a]
MPKPAKPPPKSWDGSIYGLRNIGHGATSLVFAVDDRRVVKVPIPSPFGLQAVEQEREIYRRLGRRSNHIVSCYDPDHSSGILLERCKGSVRDRLREMRQEDGSIPRESWIQVGRWAYQAAQGLGYIHEHNVIQADVGCHNMLLDRRDNLKLADFSGSSIEDSDCQALVIYDVRCRLSNVDKPDRASDLFALGCAMYEMATGHLPYHDLPSRQVQRHFFRQEFPSLDELWSDAPRIAEAIDRCWRVRKPRGLKSAEEVVEVLAKEIRYTESNKVRDECQAEEQPSKTFEVSGDVKVQSLFAKSES